MRNDNQHSPFVMGRDGRARLASPEFFAIAPPKASAMNLASVASLSVYVIRDGKRVELEGVDVMNPGPPEAPSMPTSFSRRLQMAVLEDAFRVLASGGTTLMSTHDDYVRDVWWVQGRRPSVPGFSLEDICLSLGYDTDEVRVQLLAVAEKGRSGLSQRKVSRQLAGDGQVNQRRGQNKYIKRTAA